MISSEQRKRLQEMTPEELRRFALLTSKKIKENRAKMKAKPKQE